MALADLSVVLTDVILQQIVPLYTVNIFFFHIRLCGLIDCLTHAATDLSVWFTVAFTFDRFVAISCRELKAKYCRVRTAAAVLGVVCALSILKNIPWYFRYKPLFFFLIPLFCIVDLSYYTSPLWKMFDLMNLITTPLLPFLLILLFNALTVRCIVLASRARRRLRKDGGAESQPDAELENRRKSVILLFSISASFVLLWTTHAVYRIHERLTINHILHRLVKQRLPDLVAYLGPMLQLLGTCSNTCIYVVTQNKVRQQLKKVLLYPCCLLTRVLR